MEEILRDSNKILDNNKDFPIRIFNSQGVKIIMVKTSNLDIKILAEIFNSVEISSKDLIHKIGILVSKILIHNLEIKILITMEEIL